MKNNFISCVKGVSASGKSTRVYLLFDYLRSLGFRYRDFKFINFEGKEKTVGILFEEINLVFIGKLYKTGEVERYQGYDVMTGYFGKSSYFSDFLKENSDKFSFIVEGAGVTGTNRLRPLFLNKYCGFNNIFMQYYNYDLDDKQSYLNRIIYRSGKEPNKGTMWDKCSWFISDHRDSVKEFELVKDSIESSFCYYDLFSAPIYDFGCKIINELELGSIDSFKDFCANKNYVELNSFKILINESKN